MSLHTPGLPALLTDRAGRDHHGVIDPTLAAVLLVAFLGATLLMAAETIRSLRPPACDQCPHCQQLRVQREREEHERTEAYARDIGLIRDEERSNRRDRSRRPR